MISCAHAKDLLLYNKWQNETVYALCDEIGETERRKDRGMFFKSIHNTLNHMLTINEAILTLLYTGRPSPIDFQNFPFDTFDSLKNACITFDQRLLNLLSEVDDSWFGGILEFDSERLGRKRRIPRAFMFAQMLNHATHHRSQITSELHKMGINYGNTDMPYNPYVEY